MQHSNNFFNSQVNTFSFRSFLDDDWKRLWRVQHTDHSVWMDLLDLGCDLFLVNCYAYLHCVYYVQKVNVHLKKDNKNLLTSCWSGVSNAISVSGTPSGRCIAAIRRCLTASSSAGFWMFCLTLAGSCCGTESKSEHEIKIPSRASVNVHIKIVDHPYSLYRAAANWIYLG